MKHLDLYRMSYNDKAVIGPLCEGRHIICLIGELPWLENKPDVSCIPAGTYVVKKAIYTPKNLKQYESWFITNVPNRTRIFQHIGNIPIQDSLGCQLFGMGISPGSTGVTSSALAHMHFMEYMKDETEYTLTIHRKEEKVVKEREPVFLTSSIRAKAAGQIDKIIAKVETIKEKPKLLKVGIIERYWAFLYNKKRKIGITGVAIGSGLIKYAPDATLKIIGVVTASIFGLLTAGGIVHAVGKKSSIGKPGKFDWIDILEVILRFFISLRKGLQNG